MPTRAKLSWIAALLPGLLLAAGGCKAIKVDSSRKIPVAIDAPRELDKTTMPIYVIEPPDVLLIDAVKVLPKQPYRIESQDVLVVQVEGALPEYPITNQYQVEPGGTLNMGVPYGSVTIAGLTTPEAVEAVQQHLLNFVQEPVVSISLVQTAAQQQITGEHLVGQDGTVNLGTYGEVFVAGLTKRQAAQTIEAHLASYLDSPEVAVDVLGYNSKVYYIVTQGAGSGDGLFRFPITGNETVLDALSQINGLDPVSSDRIWIARPAPPGVDQDQILPVDWNGVVQGAHTATNYQLLPGDRLYVAHNRIVATDSFLGKLTAPIERIFGFGTFGNSTIRAFQRGGSSSGSGGF